MLSARDLAQKIADGVTTPRAVVEMCAQAIAARESEINAFVALDLDRARGRADSAAAELSVAPLRGLPFGIKDIFDTADLPTQYGSPIHAGHRPATDAVLVSLIRRAGGLVLGKTVTTPFASLQPAGTRNPVNPAHTPGGSSSGSAAAVAAGMLPLAIGSQTGGSMIRPASFCGVAGFKPSYRTLPTIGMKCFSWLLDTAGLFGAGVADVAYAAAAITGRDLDVGGAAAPGAPRIALVQSLPGAIASEDMKTAFGKAANAASRAGAKMTAINLPPIFAEATRAHAFIQNYEAAQALAYEYDHHRDGLPPLLRAQLEEGAAIPPDVYDDARRIAKRARQALAELMADYDVILTPSALGAAPSGLVATGDPAFNKLWTLMGPPCVNIPGLADPNGMPLGVQIVGRFGRDRAALEAALFVEQAIAR
ncbi:MAG: malonamidase [Xanthobacteraceae bacterium]|nr:malonamidase [Xanthobacteraceae bacterium]